MEQGEPTACNKCKIIYVRESLVITTGKWETERTEDFGP